VQIASQGSGLTTFNAMVADDFILTTNGPGTNFPPAIAITSPVSGLDVISPVTLTVAAAVADKAAVTSVVFYANGVPIATNTGSPYTAQWTNSGAGGYALTAVAQDKNGLSRTSPVVNVTVLPPAFSFAIVTEPAANTTAKVGSSVSFSVATSVTYPVTYQWYQATQNGSNALAGQTESTLILFPVTNGNAGSYTVVASSMNGTTNVTLTSTPAVLTVAQPPVITTQPQGRRWRSGPMWC